jgi:hypothetical protein
VVFWPEWPRRTKPHYRQLLLFVIISSSAFVFSRYSRRQALTSCFATLFRSPSVKNRYSMSKALANASRLGPGIRLAQAVSEFEANLSNEQKTTFRTLRSQSLESPPGPRDVMRLTAEIDRQISRNLGSRCFGPRFTNFLQGVQQFAALGDILVGGSQNIIACGVWSLVRLSLLVSTFFFDNFYLLTPL